MTTTTPLHNLTDRAKRLEDAVQGAATRTRSELSEQVGAARDAAQHRATGLRAGVAVARDDVSGWWNDIQDSWTTNVARIRREEGHAKADHDAKRAESRAVGASADADAALELAFAALDEAEYAILDSALARMDADDARAEV